MNVDSMYVLKEKVKTSSGNEKDTSFVGRNYLKFSRVFSGSVFEDDETGKNVFYRIAEIEEEEHLLVYIEKISIGEEGGNYQLVDRYRLKENELGLPDFSLNSLDSLAFIDTVTVSGYFNDIKYRVNLDNRKVVKE